MAKDWQELTALTGNSPLAVERVRLTDKDISLEGSFELPLLARLAAEDQVFVMAFVKSHGSIKEMERIFGISYPTVKNRLNRISSQFELVETEVSLVQSDVLDELSSGQINVEEALKRLS